MIKFFQKNYLFLTTGLIFFISFFLFRSSLNYYFFQDDWFVLNEVSNVTTGDLINLFKFRTDIIYWRPIGMFLFFFIGKNLFGLNPFGFHLISIFFHLINSFLIGYLSFILFKNKLAAIIAAFLYSTAAFHFMTLSWLSLTWNVIGSTFFLLALISFYLFKRLKSKLILAMTIFFFCIAITSSEFALAFPVFILLFELFYGKQNIVKILKGLTFIFPILLIDFLYILVRFIIVPIPATGEYVPIIDLKVINNIFWYGAWLVNVPEVFKNQVQASQFSFSKDPTFLEPFKPYFLPLLFSLSVFLFSANYLLTKTFKQKLFKKLFGALILLVLGLLPVIFLPQHSFPYYLTISSIGFFVFIAYVLTQVLTNVTNVSRLAIICLVGGWFFASLTTISFTRKTHWISGEQAISKKYIEKVLNEYPNLPDSKIVVITGSNDQVKQSLMDQNALKVIYNNDEVRTIYR